MCYSPALAVATMGTAEFEGALISHIPSRWPEYLATGVHVRVEVLNEDTILDVDAFNLYVVLIFWLSWDPELNKWNMHINPVFWYVNPSKPNPSFFAIFTINNKLINIINITINAAMLLDLYKTGVKWIIRIMERISNRLIFCCQRRQAVCGPRAHHYQQQQRGTLKVFNIRRWLLATVQNRTPMIMPWCPLPVQSWCPLQVQSWDVHPFTWGPVPFQSSSVLKHCPFTADR